jgi:hypothetical protein
MLRPVDAELIVMGAMLTVCTPAAPLMLRWWERRLPEDRLESAPLPATRDAAGLMVLMLGPIGGLAAIAVYFIKTGRGVGRVLGPVAACALYYALLFVTVVVVSLILGQDLDS